MVTKHGHSTNQNIKTEIVCCLTLSDRNTWVYQNYTETNQYWNSKIFLTWIVYCDLSLIGIHRWH